MSIKINRAKPQDAQTERYLITAMIVSENVCRNLYPIYDQGYFQTKLTKEISRWCMDFYRDYETAIGQEIEALFNRKSKAGRINPDLEEEIEKFLSDLSNEYSQWQHFNESYYIEMGKSYFKKRSFILLSDKIKEAAEEEDLEEAENAYSNFVEVKYELSNARDVTDPASVPYMQRDAESKPRYLFELPGALGKVVTPIHRKSLVGVLGPEKSGKTYNMMIFAVAAARQGLNVAMIETGDLSREDLDTRFNSCWTKKVSYERDVGYHFVPKMDCIYNQLNECPHAKAKELVAAKDTNDSNKIKFNVDISDPEIIQSHDVCIDCWKDREKRNIFRGSIWWKYEHIDQWTWGEVTQKLNRFRKWHKGSIVTEAFPMYQAKASDIHDWCMDKWKQESRTFDVVIVDYPDILLPERNVDFRHQENEKWMILRQISQKFDCAVIAPTQADAKSYNKDTIKTENFSEDKRKFGHVTHFLGLNKTEQEDRLGCCRMDRLMLRSESAAIVSQATVLQHLAVDNPYIASFFGRVPAINK